MDHALAPAAILIDIDNTVYNYAPCHRTGMRNAAAIASDVDSHWEDGETFVADYHHARDEIKADLEDTAAAHCRLLYFKRAVENRVGATDMDAALALHTAYWNGYFSEMKLDKDAAETLDAWNVAEIPIAWVTNFTTHRQFQKLLHLGLQKTGRFMVTSEEVGVEKPSPQIFHHALERLGIEGEIWMIGDDWNSDIAPALDLGFRAIWLDREPLPRGGKTEMTHLTIVQNWAEIRALMQPRQQLKRTG